MLTLKIIVPKDGELDSYINKPVLDRISYDAFDSKVIGVITNAIEVEDGYELTIMLRNNMQYEWINGEVSAISFRISK